MFENRTALPMAPVFLVFFVALLLNASPGLYWGEAPLLAIGASRLGISHPPGYSLYMQLGHLARYLPFGDFPFRLAVFSSAITSLAVSLLMAGFGRRWGIILGVVSGLVLMGEHEFFRYGLFPEVYALNHLFFVLAVLQGRRFHDQPNHRQAALSSILAGLGLIHHMTFLFAGFCFFPGIVRYVRKNGVRGASQLALFGAIGLSSLIYFPLRSSLECTPDWGNPQTWQRFVTLITAREEVLPSVGHILDNVASIPFWAQVMGRSFLQAITLPGTVFLLLGIGLAMKTRDWLHLSLVAGGSLLFFAVVFYQSNERYAFLLPAVILCLPTATEGVRWALAQLPAQARQLVGLILLALLGGRLAITVADTDMSSLWAPRRFATSVQLDLPVNSMVFTDESDKHFLFAYLRVRESMRIDTINLFIHLVGIDWHYEQLHHWFWRKYWVPVPADIRRAGAFGDKPTITQSLVMLNMPHHPVLFLDFGFYATYIQPGTQKTYIEPHHYGFRIKSEETHGPPILEPPQLDVFREFCETPRNGRDQLTADIFSRYLFNLGDMYSEFAWWEVALDCYALSLDCGPSNEAALRLIEERMQTVRARKN